jgi:alginate O-acetyltransferase complex protein AlgI
MLFSSWQFIFVFLPIAVSGFFAIPARAQVVRKWWLLATSLVFYAYWKVEYVPLLLFSIGFNYAIAEGITRGKRERTPDAQGSDGAPSGIGRWALGVGRWAFLVRPRALLAIGVAVNLLLLGYYKYTNFILEAFGRASGHAPVRLDIALPLAISFFTFTQIGYLVDVFRDQRLHYRPLDYSVFVVFFPHLIAGPIVRHWEIIPQFADKELKANRTDMAAGIAIFLLGLFKKVLLADPASRFADIVYGAAEAGTAITWFDAWLGTIGYAMQIYFDFSGYSDMAIGLARMFGMKFPCNFDSPYKAGNIVEFWRRWHITLQRFLREYLYFPLGGNRCGKARHLLNIMITMVVSGLWHGAGWTFLVWGALHGAYLVIAHLWRRFREARGWKLAHWSYRGACVFVTFIAVLYAWVFFRAKTLPVACRVVATMAGANGFTIPEAVNDPKRTPGPQLQKMGARFVKQSLAEKFYKPGMRWMAALLLITFLLPNTQQLLRATDPTLEPVARPGRLQFRLNAVTALILGALLFAVVFSWFVAKPSPFIYFNF